MCRRGTYIVSERVQRTIVAPRLLLDSAKHVMFGNEMRSTWMQATSKEAALDQVEERRPSHVADQERVECDLSGEVQKVPRSEALSAHKAGTKRVEEDLEGTGVPTKTSIEGVSTHSIGRWSSSAARHAPKLTQRKPCRGRS